MSVHSLVTNKYFDVLIAAVIGLNVVTMSLEYYEMPGRLEYGLKVFNYVFTTVFTIELIMKLFALGIQRYMSERWNRLDVLIVILSIVGILLEEIESKLIPINPTIIRVMRVARIVRVLKLLKMASGMRALLNTVMQALPQVGNLGLLFFLLFFIFAALGVELFGRLDCDDDHPCQGMSEHAHFQHFGMAFLTLFRVATGDNWNSVMKDTLRDECDDSDHCLKNCCTNHLIAPLYFVVFVLLAQFVLVNVVVAVLMKHLEESHKYVEEDEDFEIDMEIARELAAEKRALEEAADRKRREDELRIGCSKRRLILEKVSSLPANFTFAFSDEQSDDVSLPHGHDLSSEKQQQKHQQLTQHSAIALAATVEQELRLLQQQVQQAQQQQSQSQQQQPRKYSDMTIMDEPSDNLSSYLISSYPELHDASKDSCYRSSRRRDSSPRSAGGAAAGGGKGSGSIHSGCSPNRHHHHHHHHHREWDRVSWMGERDGNSLSSISTDCSLSSCGGGGGGGSGGLGVDLDAGDDGGPSSSHDQYSSSLAADPLTIVEQGIPRKTSSDS